MFQVPQSTDLSDHPSIDFGSMWTNPYVISQSTNFKSIF